MAKNYSKEIGFAKGWKLVPAKVQAHPETKMWVTKKGKQQYDESKLIDAKNFRGFLDG